MSTPESSENVTDNTAIIRALNANTNVLVPNADAAEFVPSVLSAGNSAGELFI